MSLLTRFVLPQRAPRLYPDLSEFSGEKEAFSLDEGSSQLRDMFINYAPQLVQALRLPPAQKLMQWLSQPDDYESPTVGYPRDANSFI